MIKWIKRLCKQYCKGARANDFPIARHGFFGERTFDPVHNCDFYLDKGCSHVDGMLCNMKTCAILKEYKENKEAMCPVCGYYCRGKGGIGCIDKPSLCGLNDDD